MILSSHRWFFFSFVLVVISAVGIDRSWSGEIHQEPPTLTVSAEGRVEIAPDKAVVNLSVETAGEALEDVQNENRENMKRVMDRLLKLGIKKDRMQTSSLSITPQYPPRSRRQSPTATVPQIPKIIGYTVLNTLTVEVWDLAVVGRVVDSALQAGANRFSHITWALRDKGPAKLNALEHAAQKAREKAHVLAKVLNVKLIQLLAVTDGEVSSLPQRTTRGRARMSMAMDDAGSTPVSPGELTVRASVTVVYEISEE